ncbi:MAG TPA: AAA family ATPase [Bryobacteraceae bacterium]|nr:AAA family ATPase [Bryobacteraceae bacterium]
MFIRSLKLRNILSFREPPPLELRPLNILIGPNASGKSNLIDSVGLLQALPGSAGQYINDRGGAYNWIWRGRKRGKGEASIDCRLDLDRKPLVYEIAFAAVEQTFAIQRESLAGPKRSYLKRQGNNVEILPGSPGIVVLAAAESILSAYRNPSDPTPITAAARALNGIRFYRGFQTGVRDDARIGASSSGPKLPLEPDGSNLAVALHQLDFHGGLKHVKRQLSRLSTRFSDIKVAFEGARTQLYLEERGLGKISAIRLSDGTLRFLCLMAILLDPDPAPLVCIEEPEIGLHPEALALVGDALREASKRMQLVVTTHSDALVDRFTDEPEDIVVCERDFDESTSFRRLSGKQLKGWLKEYTLGDLWRRGEIGGTQR